MKKILFGLIALMAAVAVVALADSMFTGVGDSYPGVGTYKVTTDGTKATLTVDKIVAGTSISGGSVVSNVIAQTAAVAGTVTPQAGSAVTATSVVTPQAGATVTATAVVTPQTVSVPQSWTLQTVSLTDTNGVTALVVTGIVANVSVDVCTNATAAITVANGAGLLTNATVATSIANGTGLLTNVTVSTAGVTTNVLNQRP